MQWDNLQTQTFLAYLSVKPGSRALGEREEGDAQQDGESNCCPNLTQEIHPEN